MYEKEIKLLNGMRYMRNEGDDIFVFVDTLNVLAYNAGLDVIRDLFEVLEDDCDESSAMDDVTETIFYIAKRHGEKEGLEEISKCFVYGKARGKFWLEVIACKILNSEEIFKLWGNIISGLQGESKDIIIGLLSEIEKGGKGKRSTRAGKVLEENVV